MTLIFTEAFLVRTSSATSTYVTVSDVYNEMDALPLADAHCAKFGKIARFNHRERIRAILIVYPVGDLMPLCTVVECLRPAGR